MARNSAIEWTHHTFNPWWGCTKVSAGCKNCYAETFAHRIGQSIWGASAERRFFGEAHWRDPLRWDTEARREGTRRRVFCASMSDIFEGRKELDALRDRLWRVIDDTRSLDWLLLTKRPERIARYVPWRDRWPANVWLGVTTENQRWADKRIPLLLEFPAAVRFLSCEPLLGSIDLTRWLNQSRCLDWVIAGGESGHKARPMNPEWARRLRDQCGAASVPFHFKQWGHWGPDYANAAETRKRVRLVDSGGAPVTLVRLGKHAAGRNLDGRTWDEFPASRLDRATA
ncbi:MAG: phage Gp37/Gp68 family protein [Burkholderiales bacterium]